MEINEEIYKMCEKKASQLMMPYSEELAQYHSNLAQIVLSFESQWVRDELLTLTGKIVEYNKAFFYYHGYMEGVKRLQLEE